MNQKAFNKKIEQKVIKFIEDFHLIEFNDKILVALSGGADSIFLLNFLNKFKAKYKIQIGAFHLNHLLRKDAYLDQEFSRNVCGHFNIPFYTLNKRVSYYANRKKISIEEAGRILRYDALNKIADKFNYNKIATAHNLNDNCETVLLNLIKGKGVNAICGIPIKIMNIIRPILCLSKTEIESYLKINGIEYKVDISNYDESFERNYLRLEIVPQLEKKINKNFCSTVFQTTKILRDYINYTEKIISDKFNDSVQINNDINIKLSSFNKQDEFVKSEILRRVIIEKIKIEPNFKMINSILKLSEKQIGKKIVLSKNYQVIKDREILRISSTNQKENRKLKVTLGKKFRIGGKFFLIKKSNFANFNKNSKIEYIDADKISGQLFIRNWSSGDNFIPLGMKGRKKISDFLTDIKLPFSEKKNVKVLCDEEKIIYVFGHRIDDRVKITDKTKNIFKIEII